MPATPIRPTLTTPALYLAFELGAKSWTLGFGTADQRPPRIRSIEAGRFDLLDREIAAAKVRFGLPPDAPVLSCYEAGRDGFWLHRALTQRGIINRIIDSASIQVDRRQRRRKTDKLDAASLVGLLRRWHQGEDCFRIVHVPTPQQEDARHLHRELDELKHERTAHTNRIKGLLAALGCNPGKVTTALAGRLDQLRDGQGQPLPPGLVARLRHELDRLDLLQKQIHDLEKEQKKQTKEGEEDPAIKQVRQLMGLKGVGLTGAWLLVREFFSWREFKNGREVGSLAGLAPSPYQSGKTNYEQGISKAGSRWVRALAIEMAWCWTMYQPDSELTRWFLKRFGDKGQRHRKVGIVALAHKLLVGLWRYLQTGEAPKGATVVGWEAKF